MIQYLDLLQDILDNGTQKSDRTNTGTISVFGRMIKFDLDKGFPLLTTKKLSTKNILTELLWFLGIHMKDVRYKNLPLTNIKYLTDNKNTIWNEWADNEGNLGKVYHKQWLSWETNGKFINQVDIIIDRLKNNPDSRRMIVSAWNVGELDDMALVPCHYSWHVNSVKMTDIDRIHRFSNYVNINNINITGMNVIDAMKHYNFPERKLNLIWNQRSVDTLLGLPYNIASYAYLTHMLAQVTNHCVGELTGMLGDVHIYLNHMQYVKEQLTRTPKSLPNLSMNTKVDDIYNFKLEDFTITNYSPYPNWKNVPIAV